MRICDLDRDNVLYRFDGRGERGTAIRERKIAKHISRSI